MKKRNEVWVIEGRSHRKDEWEPVFEMFYHTKKHAMKEMPSEYIGFSGNRITYRIRKYVAEEEK